MRGHQSQSRSRSREREKNRSVAFYVQKMGLPTNEAELKAMFCLYGEVTRIQQLGSGVNPQKIVLEMKLSNAITTDHILNYLERQRKQDGWYISTIPQDQIYSKPPVANPMPPGAYLSNAAGPGVLGENMMPRYPNYHMSHAPAPQPNMGHQKAGQGMIPNMGGQPAANHGHYMNPSMQMPQYYPQMRSNANHMGGRPPAPPAPSMSGGHSNSGPNQPPNVPEEKIEVNEKMVKNLKILKNPSKMIELLKLDRDVLQKLVLGLANENKLSLVVHNIRVREIWVGNLNPETTEADVRNAFCEYGQIESIEMFNKSTQNQIFAFLKYLKVSQAARAFENIDNLSLAMKLNLRISYSDFSKRNGVVGDSATVEDNVDDLTPYLFLAFSSGVNLPRQKSLLRRFAEFGKIKGVLMKPSYDSNFKSFIIVEFERVEEAIKARRYYFLQDKGAKRRSKLGARDIDINILTKVAEFRKFELPPQLMKNTSSEISAKYNLIMSKLKAKSPNQEIQDIFEVKADPKSAQKNKDPEVEIMQEEYQENSALTGKYELSWSGMVYRSKKSHFLADAHYVSGDIELGRSMPDRLILSHKTSIKEALSRKRIAIMAIVPTNSVAFKDFVDSLEDFQKTDTVAITYQIKKTVFYLIPYHDKLKELIPELDRHSFVGILVERGETESEDVNSKLVNDSEAATVVIEDKKDNVMRRHDYSNTVNDFDSEDDNYSNSLSNQDSPEGSENQSEDG